MVLIRGLNLIFIIQIENLLIEAAPTLLRPRL